MPDRIHLRRGTEHRAACTTLRGHLVAPGQERPAAPHPLARPPEGRHGTRRRGRVSDRREEELGREERTVQLRGRWQLAGDVCARARHAPVHGACESCRRNDRAEDDGRPCAARLGSARATRRYLQRQVTQDEAGSETPGGLWIISVDRAGWRIKDPQGYENWIDAAYPADGRFELRGGIWTNPFDPAITKRGGNGWCQETNAPVDYVWAVSADLLTIAHDGADACGSPNNKESQIVAGAWTRVG